MRSDRGRSCSANCMGLVVMVGRENRDDCSKFFYLIGVALHVFFSIYGCVTLQKIRHEQKNFFAGVTCAPFSNFFEPSRFCCNPSEISPRVHISQRGLPADSPLPMSTLDDSLDAGCPSSSSYESLAETLHNPDGFLGELSRQSPCNPRDHDEEGQGGHGGEPLASFSGVLRESNTELVPRATRSRCHPSPPPHTAVRA